jgi:catechol 2,3-dioxygenase-like lactoylglutathione lyase family enzyme
VTNRPPIGVERVDFISVPVTDLARATAFYEDVLGLQRVPGQSAWPEFAIGNVALYLVNPAQIGRPFTGPHSAYIALRVPDVAAARAELEARGVTFDGDIFDTGVCHMGFFRDPDGNALMLHHRYAPYPEPAEAS